jgi:hypothetical protein
MKKLKVLIIGTLHLKDKMLKHKEFLESHDKCEVRLPVMDDYSECKSALDLIKTNIERIKWADEIHMFWDGRSVGTIADWQTSLALGKYVIPMYIEKQFTYQKAMEEHFFSLDNKTPWE